MANYLWQFTTSSNAADLTPVITPVNTGTSFTAPIDVVNEFYWTNSKLGTQAGGRQEVPTLILKERTVKTNSFVAQALYSTGAIGDSLGALGVDTPLKDVEALLAKAKNAVKSASSAVTGALGNGTISAATSTVAEEIVKGISSAQDDPLFLKDPWLRPYKGLYLTEPTGWIYYLPFISANKYQSTSNNWGDSSGQSGGQMVLGAYTSMIDEGSKLLGDIATTFDVGSYQEKPKFYNYDTNGDQITVSFPLINTGSATYDDVVRNWQFIYMLIYQNRPERLTRNIVNPPPIYEAEIPGVRYMPLSFISNIDVEYRGARRTMKITIPTDKGQSSFQTIIPEAYQLTITLSTLLGESKNFLYAAAAKPNNITVYDIKDLDVTSLTTPNLNAAEAIGAQQLKNIQQQNLNLPNSLGGSNGQTILS